MCGICGYMSLDHISDEILVQMANTIKHRGPDASGIFQTNFRSTFVGLAHRRLSIIDVDPRSNQPFLSNDGNVSIVYNGEVYNFEEIKISLKKKYDFTTTSDTEVIVAAYQEYGINFVDKLIGIFSIALFDHVDGKLHLIRDRHGVKPLYYYKSIDSVVFASELRPIMEYSSFPKSLDLESVQVMLAMKYVPAPKTIFKDVYKVNPGTVLTFESGNIVSERKYWDSVDVYLNTTKNNPSLDEYVLETEKAVKRNLISDVGVATFLSGGIDSSLVSAFAKKHKNDIVSYTIGFESKKHDESKFAEEVSKALQIDNKKYIVGYQDMVDTALVMAEIFDEPFGDSSQIPTYLVSKAVANDGVKVVLSGDGGDEFFYGYNMYDLSEWVYSKYKKLKPLTNIYHYLSRWHSYLLPGYVSYLFTDLKRFYYGLYSGYSGYYSYRAMKQRHLPIFMNSSFSFLDKIQNEHPIVINSLFDQNIYMIDDILVKVDRASMAHSLESRVPLLDHSLSLKAYETSYEMHYSDGEKKTILKRVLGKLISESLFIRKKQGFSIPLFELLNESSIKAKILEYSTKERLIKQKIFNWKTIQRQVGRFYNKKEQKMSDYLWNYFMFQSWYYKYMKDTH